MEIGCLHIRDVQNSLPITKFLVIIAHRHCHMTCVIPFDDFALTSGENIIEIRKEQIISGDTAIFDSHYENSSELIRIYETSIFIRSPSFQPPQ